MTDTGDEGICRAASVAGVTWATRCGRESGVPRVIDGIASAWISKPISCMFTDAPLSCSIGVGIDDIGGDGASREGPGELVGVVEKSRRLLGLLGLEGAVRVAPLIPKLRVSLLSTPRESQLT